MPTSPSSPTRPTTCRASRRRAGLHEVSLYVNDGERARARGRHRRLRRVLRAPAHGGTTLPTTSQPSIGDFLAVYEPLVARRPRHRLDPHLRRDLGHGRGRAPGGGRARRARAERAHRGRRLRAAPAARSALVVARRRRRGARRARDVDAVAARAREAAGATRLWFAVDTLEYLRRGGRIGAAQAWLGGALKIKPILTFDGEIDADRARAHRRAARSSGWSTTCARATTTAPTAGSSSTSRRPTSAERLVDQRARDLRQRAGFRLRDRAGHRRPRGPGPGRRRRHPVAARGGRLLELSAGRARARAA